MKVLEIVNTVIGWLKEVIAGYCRKDFGLFFDFGNKSISVTENSHLVKLQ